MAFIMYFLTQVLQKPTHTWVVRLEELRKRIRQAKIKVKKVRLAFRLFPL